MKLRWNNISIDRNFFIRMSECTLSMENDVFQVEKSALIKSSSKTKIYLFELEECKVKDERLRLFMRSIL